MIKTGTPLIFPFLLGRAFIEAEMAEDADFLSSNFPSFWEGLSLRLWTRTLLHLWVWIFPFLLGRAFIEAIAVLLLSRL